MGTSSRSIHDGGRAPSTPDLPYVNGQPVSIDGQGWAIVLLGVAVGLACLMVLPTETFPATLVVALLFMGIPLLALRFVAGPHWRALFAPLGLRQVGQMVLFAVLTLVASVVVGVGLGQLGLLAPNPVVAGMVAMSGTDYVLRLVPTVPQLVGEELLTILPLLAILWFATARLGQGRRAGIVLAVVGSSLIFGAAHLPTYDWHVAQCFGVIGVARVVLTMAYLWTHNLWVSAGAYILNDWSKFTLGFIFSHVPVGTD